MLARSVWRQAVTGAVAAAMLASGCTRMVNHRLARLELRGDATASREAVPEAAVWKVKVRARGEKEYHGIDGTERFLRPGDSFGFRTDDAGIVYAVVNNEQMPLALTADHERVAWHASWEESTGVAEAFGTAAGVAAGAVIVGGLTALSESMLDDDCCKRGRYCSKHRRRR